MIIKPAGMSRRGFLRGILGVTTAIIVPSHLIVRPTLQETLYAKLTSGDPCLTAQATDAVNDFLRTKMREDAFYRRILPPVPILGLYLPVFKPRMSRDGKIED